MSGIQISDISEIAHHLFENLYLYYTFIIEYNKFSNILVHTQNRLGECCRTFINSHKFTIVVSYLLPFLIARLYILYRTTTD